MLCSKPYRQGVMAYGCGQCAPCLINKRRLWTGRIMLEACMHAQSWFVTLTYDKEHRPCDGCVSVRDAQLFLKRLRASVPERIRYFLVGEYGERTWRPHYHAILFGLRDPRVVSRCWELGFVHVGSVSEASAAYVVGYTVKKMTRKGDVRLGGRHPEFALRSLKPGIGAPAIDSLRQAISSSGTGGKLLDVPGMVRFGDLGKFPLGRYLMMKLRQSFGSDGSVPSLMMQEVVQKRIDLLTAPGGLLADVEGRIQSEWNAVGKLTLKGGRREAL